MFRVPCFGGIFFFVGWLLLVVGRWFFLCVLFEGGLLDDVGCCLLDRWMARCFFLFGVSLLSNIVSSGQTKRPCTDR